jgi:phage shock protein PspC (stress-responsive transcriptional regulator)
MNKTISIHIQGFPFILEEQAYQELQDYLDALKRVLEHEEGKDEIIQDIELRIVELLQEKVTVQQVVQLEQISQIIQLLGSPDTFADSEATSEQKQSAAGPEQMTVQKRFFRDPENPVLGGVASGVAAYFNIDVVFVRVFFVLFTMVFGSGIPIYIILWIVTPRAKTASEKLQMRGRAVNVENIKTEFKEAAERVENNAKKWSSQLKAGSGLSQGTQRIINFLKVSFGIFLLIFGLSLIISVGLFLFIDPELIPAQINGEFTSLGVLSSLFFETSQLNSYIYLGAALIGFSWGLSSLLTGIRLLLAFHSKWLNVGYLSFGTFTVVGILLIFYVGIATAKDFTIESELRKDMRAYNGDSLNLVISNELHLKAFNQHKLNLSANGYKMSKHPDQGLVLAENGKLYISGIAVNYEESMDSLYHISVLKRANASSYMKANLRAAHIQFPCKLEGKALILASGFAFPASDRMRDQEVEIVIAVPSGKSVLWKDRVVYPYVSEFSPDQSSNRAYIHGDGHYSSW